ncbi:Uncharacterised protein [Parvimonas micra]|nr:hypothetical protein EGS00_02590 [Parvimonas micra]VEH97594.1 Uncharacterised protein [Parvimonas micra]
MEILKKKIYTIFSFLIFLFYLITLELSAGSYPSDQPYMHNPTIFKNFLLVISLIFIFIFIIILITRNTKYFLVINIGIILFFIFRVFEFFKKYKRLYQDTLTIILLLLAIISVIIIFVLISKMFKKLNK